jgi:heptosyltransferase III
VTKNILSIRERVDGLAGGGLRLGLRTYFRLRMHRLRARCCAMASYRRVLKIRQQVKKENPNRKLVVIALVEHMGDIVAAEPIARHVRQEWPEAYILWCVRAPYSELIGSNPHVDQALVVRCLTEWIHLRAKGGLFDEIIDLHFNNRGCNTCRVPIQKSEGDSRVSMNNYLRLGNLLTVFCRSAGLPTLCGQSKIYISREVERRVDALLLPDEFVVIHCKSTSTTKDWTGAKWQELGEKIIDSWQVKIVEVGLEPIVGGKLGCHYCLDLCGKLSLLETAEVIRRARLFIGVDSGPAHLANAVGTPGVLLLGLYNGFEEYMPYNGSYGGGSNVTLIYSDGATSNIPVRTVVEKLEGWFKSAVVMSNGKFGSGRL